MRLGPNKQTYVLAGVLAGVAIILAFFLWMGLGMPMP